MNVSLVASLSIHVVLVAAWLGSMFFLAFALMPALKQPAFQSVRVELIRTITTRLKYFSLTILTLLALTGIWNLFGLGFDLNQLVGRDFWLDNPKGRTLMEKITLYGILLALSLTHDFLIGPKAFETVNGQLTENALKYRKRAMWFGRINLLLTLLVVVWGILLRFR